MSERFNDNLLRMTLVMLMSSVAISANDRPRAPIPRAPLIVEQTTPTKPVTPTTEQSDLHSHLCSNPHCKYEWWHDPRKGPVSHNCPKCGREEWIINRHAPTGSRPTTPTAAISSQQVVREPVHQKTVYVVGSTSCYACNLFRLKHGTGDEHRKYVYAHMDHARPAEIPQTTWNEIVRHNNTLSFTWPFFVVERDGKFVASQSSIE